MAVRLDPYQRVATVAMNPWGPLVAPLDNTSGTLLRDGARFAVALAPGSPAFSIPQNPAPGWGNAIHGMFQRMDAGGVLTGLAFDALSGDRSQWQTRRLLPVDASMDTILGAPTGGISRRWSLLTSTSNNHKVYGWGWEPVLDQENSVFHVDQPWRPGRVYRDGTLVASYGDTVPNPWGTTTRPYVLGFQNGVVVLPTTLFYKSFIYRNYLDTTGTYNGEQLRTTTGVFNETNEIETPRPTVYRDDLEDPFVLPWLGLDTTPSPAFRDTPVPMVTTDEKCTFDVVRAVYAKPDKAWYLLVDFTAQNSAMYASTTGIEGPFPYAFGNYYTQESGAWRQDDARSRTQTCRAILKVTLNEVRVLPGAFAFHDYTTTAEPTADTPDELVVMDRRLLFIGRDAAAVQGLYEYDLTTGERRRLGALNLPAIPGYNAPSLLGALAFNQRERLFYGVGRYHMEPTGTRYFLLTSADGVNWSVANTTPLTSLPDYRTPLN